MNEYEFWLFDLDGTLVDVEWDYKSTVIDAVADEMGWSLSKEDKWLLWHGDGGVRSTVLDELGVELEDYWTTFDEIEDPTARAEATYLYNDASWISDLETPVGLVTHCPKSKTERVLDRLDIGDWFDVVVCCDEDLGWKPDPFPVTHAKRELGVHENGHEGVLAGDGPHDVGAAWNAGLDAVHVERHGHDRREQCVLADYRVESFEELLAVANAD